MKKDNDNEQFLDKKSTNSNLTPEKDQEVTNDEYDKLFKKANLDLGTTLHFEEKASKGIIKLAKYQAKISTILIVLTILLLIVPVLTLCSYLYYGTGNRANDLLDTTKNLIYVTKPNTMLEEGFDTRIGFFSMDANFNTLKRVGKQSLNSEAFKVHYTMKQFSAVERQSKTSIPVSESNKNHFIFPSNNLNFDKNKEWEVLNGLSSGSVAELYISFDDLYSPQEVEHELPKSIDTLWLAVNSGVENSQNSEQIIPLGYPTHSDTNLFSPFFGAKVAKQGIQPIFLKIVEQLAQRQKLISTFPNYQNTSFSKRLDYIKKNGILTYGVVVTGPSEELKKLKSNKIVRTIKVGEVELWNWHS
ncbi:hypothetical protein ASL14_13215 [Paenibacillus sp. IHB B 3084]|uniref:anti-sigma factor n=1 Tax=Paenibacillus sp. IHB B 3084 TaxID=867076 RepID=UPI000722BD20|nr:anti-sigma factor [Paenibacillus sp. IHB B 3084]ALP36983.1 hypothetical protein ASL14_13215 [Paenibacillus sp. IHB B 3084]